MKIGAMIITLFLAFVVQLPQAAYASWWNGNSDGCGLDLESGYDTNTVTTISGTITALHLDGPRPQALVEMAAGEGPVTVVFGPRTYWAEHGIPLEVGEQLTVRGSKAQGGDGVVYVLAQWLSQERLGRQLALRSETGKPVWSGSGGRWAGQAGGRLGTPHPNGPGRMGVGRMGR